MKTPKASTTGRRGGLWLTGLAGLVVVPPVALLVAVTAPTAGAFGLAGLSLAAALLLYLRSRVLSAAHEKLSGEIGVLSQRLLKAESLAATVVQAVAAKAAAQEPVQGAGPEAEDAARTDALSAGIEEVTAEIGLLSGIVRELASVVSAQEGEIARLKAAPPPAAPPAPVARPVPAPEAREPLARPISRPAPQPPQPGRPVPPAANPRLLVFEPPVFEPPPQRDPAREAGLVEAFDGEGLEVWLQPVVTLPQRKVVSYEALARLRLGAEILEPDAFLPVLERHGRTTALDRRMLQRVALIARHLQGRGSAASVVYGLSPLSLFEPGFMRSLASLAAIGQPGERDAAGRVALALPQAAWRSLDAEQAALLAALRGRVGFVLDRPDDLRFDVASLAERGVGQVKVPARLLLRPPARSSVPDIALEDLVAALGRAGIRLVAVQVEHEAEVPDLIDLDVPLAQGEVFAGARPVRAEVFASDPAQQPPVPEPPPAPTEPTQRRPFRDFLRRAV